MVESRDLHAVILCGGLGLRLRPVIGDRPKCLAPIGRRPFIEFLLLWLKSFGIRKITLCTGYRSEQVREALEDGSRWNIAVNYAIESEPLGTAGALRNAEPFIDRDPFLVLNGDSMLDVPLDDLARFHRLRNGVVTLALCRISAAADRYGSVAVDTEERVVSFMEKQQISNQEKAAGTAERLVNGGVYVCGKGVFGLIPQAPPSVSLEKEIFPRLIGHGLYGFASEGYFIDIGLPEDYKRAQNELPARFP